MKRVMVWKIVMVVQHYECNTTELYKLVKMVEFYMYFITCKFFFLISALVPFKKSKSVHNVEYLTSR